MAPTETWEPREVTVGRDQLAARLDREGRQVRVGHEVASCRAVAAQPNEDRPVSFAGRDGNSVRCRTERLGERDRLVHRRRGIEDPRMGGDAYEAGKDRLGKCERLLRVTVPSSQARYRS